MDKVFEHQCVATQAKEMGTEQQYGDNLFQKA
jgi:hypothetical protein